MSFSNIKNKTYLNYYVHEIWSISSSINSLKIKLEQNETVIEAKKKPANNILSNDYEPHEIISSILNHTARLNKLFLATNCRDDELKDGYKFRQERSEILRKLFLPKKKTAHEILKSKVRNSVEHFDERLDSLMRNIIELNTSINSKTIVYNMTLSSEECFSNWNRILPVKVFVIDGLKYFMLDINLDGLLINLGEVFSENDQILKKCIDWAKLRPDERGNIAKSPCGIIKTPPHIL